MTEKSTGSSEQAHHGHSHGHAHSTAGGVHHPGQGVSSDRGFVEDQRVAARTMADLERGAGSGKVLFLQLVGGIAGDMTIAALHDLGVPAQVIRDAIDSLGLGDVELVFRRGYAGAIGCTHFDVRFSHQEGERSYAEIVRLIEASGLSLAVKDLALRVFRRLGEAEAAVHSTPLSTVHFHEVGAVDSIVDIVGAAASFDYLGATVISSPAPLGSGYVTCRHGVLPLPAPATAYCLVGVPTIDSGLQTELVTPTGAAILATIASDYATWAPMRPLRMGWGAGTKGLIDRPNVLRAVLGQPLENRRLATHILLEANLDDMTGEQAAHALEQVLSAGALDCWITPVTMKKGRPGLVFSALGAVADSARLADTILRETTTIGVRQSLVSRVELARETRTVVTPLGSVRVKISRFEGDGTFRLKPEMDDCSALAKKLDLPLSEVLRRINPAIEAELGRG